MRRLIRIVGWLALTLVVLVAVVLVGFRGAAALQGFDPFANEGHAFGVDHGAPEFGHHHFGKIGIHPANQDGLFRFSVHENNGVLKSHFCPVNPAFFGYSKYF